jgi:flagellar M-ring protein FliF
VDFQQLLARLKTLTSSFSAGQLATIGVTFVLVVGLIVGSAWWLNAPTYTLLFSDLDAESAGQMVTRLKTLKVKYQLDEGGRAIRVPSDRVDELRLELTAQGMPASGRVGFEIFDRTAFGATQFLEQVNYRRALEGEIARTIATITEVSSARVHIAMGKESLFGDPRPAKASVVLKLRGQRGLSESTIAGISNLVASSVEGLRPDSVVIIDTFGRPLAQPRDEGNVIAAQHVERQQRIEREMSARVVTLLEPVIGPDRVRVNVAVKLNPQTLEETEERWDPNTVVRTRQMTADQATSAALGGIAGARGNIPPSPADPAKPETVQAAAPTGPGSSRNAETTTYEVSRTTRHTLQPPGEVARLSVAVILDDDHVAKAGKDGQPTMTRRSRTPEELQKIQSLVAAAVGLEPDRGDLITVENVAFDEPVVFEEPPSPFYQRYSPQIWEGGRIAAVLMIAVGGFFLIIRPMMRRIGIQPAPAVALAAAGAAAAQAVATAVPGRGPRTVAEMESEIDAQLDALTAQYAEDRRLPVLTRRISSVTVNEPESVAKLLRNWISDTER